MFIALVKVKFIIHDFYYAIHYCGIEWFFNFY